MEGADTARENEPDPEWGYVGRIPVRNLWLLMLYASDLFRSHGKGGAGLEENPDDLPDLVAEILAHTVEERQRRRLSLGYRTREAALNRVRGRIDLLATERRRLLSRGLVACRFDELTIDTPGTASSGPPWTRSPGWCEGALSPIAAESSRTTCRLAKVRTAPRGSIARPPGRRSRHFIGGERTDTLIWLILQRKSFR